MATLVDYICYWYDGNEHRLTRCQIDPLTAKPEGFPPTGDCMLIIEASHGYEPIFWNGDTTNEMGIENSFP